MTKTEIREFLKEYCEKVVEIDIPEHMWELLMDDHRGIKWYGVEYIMPENCSFWTPYEYNISNHLYDNHAY
tara:strand:- start:1188 stop:1400 length:213 start_codon:yes stop_codon:yes gene_type:complete